MPTALVVGQGSIGERHARLLGDLGLDVAVVSRRGTRARTPAYQALDKALDEAKPDYVVVANETAAHRPTLIALASAGFAGRVLVEKPLFDRLAPVPEHRFAACFIGYNLRFHPVLQELARVLAEERAISAHLYVGQYLPDWRPSRDYRETASASRQAGGGVLRDLSHELDYLSWLFGRCERLAALGGRFSELEIDSDDVQGLLLAFERCPVVTAQLNYLDRRGTRSLIVNTAKRTLVADLVGATLAIGSEQQVFPLGRDDTYLAQHRRVLGNAHEGLCTLNEGAAVLELIAAAEAAAATGQWIRL
jgi:predicted dehydrogenase